MPFEAHVEGIALATSRLTTYAQSVGLAAGVRSCPGWDVHDLVAHLGMVQRWATSHVAGDPVSDPERFEEEGRASGSPLTWLGHGSDRLIGHLRRAPSDLETFFFLRDARSPRDGWARRQCHEATVHAFDVLTAQQGARPLAADADLDAELAADGIDEMLCGFATRRSMPLRNDRPAVVEVRTTDTGDVWRCQVSQEPLVTERTGLAADADAVVSGTAAELYLSLWSRTDEWQGEGRDARSFWREHVHVRWG